jgi:hypothetical protein
MEKLGGDAGNTLCQEVQSSKNLQSSAITISVQGDSLGVRNDALLRIVQH